MLMWIFVYLYKNVYFNAYMIHLCTFQDSKNAGSLSSLSSTPPPSSSAPQDVDGTGAVKYSEFLVVVVGDNKEQDSALGSLPYRQQ